MMNDKANNEDSGTRRVYFKDIRLFPIIIFMVALGTAALINTQAGMQRVVEILAFFALGFLIIGIATQAIKMRK